MPGHAVVVVPSGGLPVNPVDSGAPVLSAVESGGFPITLTARGAPFILDGGIIPPSPPLGPLEVVGRVDGFFTNFSQEFNLERDCAVVGLCCAFSGDPVITITHGGETLDIVKQERIGEHLALLAYGTGLTVEVADLEITATGGELNGGAMRINEIDPTTVNGVGWVYGDTGHGNIITPATQQDVIGGIVKGALVTGGADRYHVTSVEGATNVWSGYTTSGVPIATDTSVTGPWVLGDGWSIDGDAFVHTGGSGTLSISYPTVPAIASARMTLTVESGEVRIGPNANSDRYGVGLHYVSTAHGFAVSTTAISATGNCRVEGVTVVGNATMVSWLFCTTPAQEDEQISFTQPYGPDWAYAFAEVTCGDGPTPPPFEADYYIADGGTGNGLTPEAPASWATAYAAATNGDVLGLVGDVTLPQNVTIAKDITILGQRGAYDVDPLGTGQQVSNRFERKYKLKLVPPNAPGNSANRVFCNIGAGNTVTFEDVHFTFPYWPEEGQFWESIGVNGAGASQYLGGSATSSLVLKGCEASHGWGPDHLPYDPTVKLDEYKSPAVYWFKAKADDPNSSWGDITAIEAEAVVGSQSYVGWGDATFPGYNTTMRGPNFLDERWANVHIEDCYFHDMREAIKVRSGGAGTFVYRRNWVERMYCDFSHFQLTNTVTDMTGSVIAEQNIFLDPVGCNLDNGDPHNDWDQKYATRPEANQANATRLRNIYSQRNFWGVTRGNVRALAQGHFYQTSSDHQVNNKAVLDYPVIRDNVAIGGIYKAFTNEGVRDPIFTRNLMINPTWFTPQILSQPAALAYARFFPNTGTARVTFTDTKALSKDNIVETYFTNMSAATEGQHVTGLKGATIPHADMFVDPSAPAGVVKPGVLYNKYRPKGSYVGAGPDFSSLYELAYGEVDYSGKDVWLGFPDLVNQPASTQVTSQIFYCHGTVGEPISVTLPTGVEMRTLQVDRTTQVAGYTNTPTVTAGMYGQLRVTTPATGFVNYNIVVNGQSNTWFVGRGYPGDPPSYLVADGTSWLYSPTTIGSGRKRVRAEFWLRIPTLPASGSLGLFSQTGARIILEVLNSGSVRTSLRDSANNALLNLVYFSGLTFASGGSYRCVYEADMEAKTVIFTVNGQEYLLESTVTSTGLFSPNRLMIGANSESTTAGRFPSGICFGDFKIYLDDVLYHEVSNDAATTNASAWLQGDGFTQGTS